MTKRPWRRTRALLIDAGLASLAVLVVLTAAVAGVVVAAGVGLLLVILVAWDQSVRARSYEPVRRVHGHLPPDATEFDVLSD